MMVFSVVTGCAWATSRAWIMLSNVNWCQLSQSAQPHLPSSLMGQEPFLAQFRSGRGEGTSRLSVILVELIAALSLNSPDPGCQNYNCVSHFLSRVTCVTLLGIEVLWAGCEAGRERNYIKPDSNLNPDTNLVRRCNLKPDTCLVPCVIKGHLCPACLMSLCPVSKSLVLKCHKVVSGLI